jgi:hypothetical protein
MEEIFEPNDQFPFDKLELLKPVLANGGNYFIKFISNNSPLYIQPPKCMTKQGIIKGTKRMYSDLMFTNDNPAFIRWMENLELHCQKIIYENRSAWFEGDLEMHDIENYFTSPMKVFKSGKFYIVRSNISLVLGKTTLKIYDEDEKEVNPESINEETNVMTILEFQGIKCSARSFQIDIEIKQMMVLKPRKLFEKCVIKTSNASIITNDNSIKTSNDIISSNNELISIVASSSTILEPDDNMILKEQDKAYLDDKPDDNNKMNNNDIEEPIENSEYLGNSKPITVIETKKTEPKSSNELEEVEFDLEEIPNADLIQIKKRNDVYYEMYKEARRKAKIARDLALSAFLECKNIKNTYMLDDISDSSDDSDVENLENE